MSVDAGDPEADTHTQRDKSDYKRVGYSESVRVGGGAIQSFDASPPESCEHFLFVVWSEADRSKS